MKLLIILLITLIFNSFAQIKGVESMVFGTRFNGYILSTTEHSNLGKSKTMEYRFEPYFLYPVGKRISLGVIGEYQSASSTLDFIEIPEDNYGIGVLGRYYYPLKFKRESLLVFGEVSFSVTNYYNSEENLFPVTHNGALKYGLIRFRPIGFNYNIYKGMSLDLSVCFFKFLPGRFRVLPNIGLSFLF